MRDTMQAGNGLPSEPCARCEAGLAELLDGTLTPQAEAELRAHAAGCDACRALLENAESGKAWLQMLHDSPPPVPEELLGRILAQTSGHPVRGLAEPSTVAGVPAAIGQALAPVWALPGSRTNRWLMTAAMAFFSIAVSLSVAGVRASDLHPSAVQAAAYRQFFDMKKQVVSFYDNLTVVRELQSTVDTLHRGHGSTPGNTSLDSTRPYARDAMPVLSLFTASLAAEERNHL